MAYTAQNVYDEVCRLLLEDTGLQLVYSTDSFLNDLTVSVREFLQRTGIAKDVVTISGLANTSTYTVADEHMEVQAAFWNGRHLSRNSGYYMDEDDPYWESNQDTPPEQWREDRLEKNKVQIAPKPTVNGTIKLICTEQPSSSLLALDSTISLIPDSFACYLKWFALVRIWKTEGEARDLQRAEYARARCDEAISLAKAIMTEDLLVN